MGKGNMFLGQVRGSVGDVTFWVGRGQQLSRVRRRQIGNPRSTSQQIQRMIFASVSWAYQLLKSIADHSFEGISYGGPSQAKFFSLNLKALRAYYPTDQDPNKRPVDAKAYILPSREGAIGCGLQIAAGTLPEIAPQVNENGVLIGFGNTVAIPEGQQMTVARMLVSLGAVKGDQITIVAVTNDNRLLKSRYVVRPDATDAETNVEWDSAGELAVFDATKTEVGVLRIEIDDRGFAKPVLENGDIMDDTTSVALILSRKEGNKWLRSNAWLWNTMDEAPQYSAAYALPYWEMSGTEIDTLNKRYLNNADV